MRGEPFELHLRRTLGSSYEIVEGRMRDGPERWLPGFRREGERVTGELSFEQAGARVDRRTEVRVGPVQRFGYGVTVEIAWKGAGHPERYPELEGHLRLEPDQTSGSVLRFDARYTPPGGRVGATIDRAVMHRVAESSVNDFVDRVAERLGAP